MIKFWSHGNVITVYSSVYSKTLDILTNTNYYNLILRTLNNLITGLLSTLALMKYDSTILYNLATKMLRKI